MSRIIIVCCKVTSYFCVDVCAFSLIRNFCYMLTGGSEGLFAQKTLEITDDVLQTYKNQGWLVDYKVVVKMLQNFISSVF